MRPRDVARLLGEELIERPPHIRVAPGLAGREARRRAPAAVFEKPWGDHVDPDAFGHEELCIAARQPMHAQFGPNPTLKP